jgi:hypothetical protein
MTPLAVVKRPVTARLKVADDIKVILSTAGASGEQTNDLLYTLSHFPPHLHNFLAGAVTRGI